MDDDSSGLSSELVNTFDTPAGPAVVHGPQAEPDSPPLTRASVAALEALVALAAADGITARLELPATRDRGRPTNWPPCPEHPTTHPLQLVAGSDVDPRPRWSCPLTGAVVTALPPLGGADPV